MLLRGLKGYVAPRQRPNSHHPISDLVAMVTVTDDGGSSARRLRREYSVLPPGDLRNCMVALSEDEALLSRSLQYRFHSGRGLRGHSFGNLFLTALSNITGDFTRAVRVSGEVLAIGGRIFPSTNQLVSLEAALENGKAIAGETRRGATRVPIRSRCVWFRASEALAGRPGGHRRGRPDTPRPRLALHQHHSESAGFGRGRSHRKVPRHARLHSQSHDAAGRDARLHAGRSCARHSSAYREESHRLRGDQQ